MPKQRHEWRDTVTIIKMSPVQAPLARGNCGVMARLSVLHNYCGTFLLTRLDHGDTLKNYSWLAFSQRRRKQKELHHLFQGTLVDVRALCVRPISDLAVRSFSLYQRMWLIPTVTKLLQPDPKSDALRHARDLIKIGCRWKESNLQSISIGFLFPCSCILYMHMWYSFRHDFIREGGGRLPCWVPSSWADTQHTGCPKRHVSSLKEKKNRSLWKIAFTTMCAVDAVNRVTSSLPNKGWVWNKSLLANCWAFQSRHHLLDATYFSHITGVTLTWRFKAFYPSV